MRDNGMQYIYFLLKGYGQVFFCNNPWSGMLFLVAMFLMSPRNAVLSLASALIITMIAARNRRNSALLHTGLPGVNGALLGYFWILFPEIPFQTALIATIPGAVLTGMILIPITARLQRRKSPFMLFSLPALFVFWVLIILLRFSGITDPALFRAWHAFNKQAYPEAAEQFQAVRISTPRGIAGKLNGLGWTSFRLGNYKAAAKYFDQSIQQDRKFSDSLDGAGWSFLMQGFTYAAQDLFLQSVNRNPFKGSSLDGLGWCRYRLGELDAAKSSFQKAACLIPLYSDSWSGLAVCARASGLDAGRFRKIKLFLDRFSGTPFAFVTIFQLIAWILFFIGIAVNSRISAAVCFLVLLFSGLLGLLPGFPTVPDINFFYNLIAVAVALGGLVLVINISTAGLLMLAVILLHISYPLWNFGEQISGLPILCLPFNILLLLIPVTAVILRKLPGIHPVPPEPACTTPENVLWWHAKKSLLDSCWQIIRTHSTKNFQPGRSTE